MKSKTFFLTCHNWFFTKIFLPYFRRWDANEMTLLNQLAPKQITNLQNTTIWLQNSAKTFIKRLSQPLQTWDLRKQESIRKISNWMETDASIQSLFIFGNSSQKLNIGDVRLLMFIILEKSLQLWVPALKQ